MSHLTVQTIPVGPLQSNAYLVYDEDHADALLIDAGDDAPVILSQIKRSGTRLSAVVLTHGHFDHILAAPALRDSTGAKLLIHEADAPMLSSSARCLYAPGVANSTFETFEPDGLLREGDVLPFPIPARILHTPGHSRGGLCVYFPDHDVLFSGDTLFEADVGRTDLPGGDARVLAASISRLLALPEQTKVYPGHDIPTTIAAERLVGHGT